MKEEQGVRFGQNSNMEETSSTQGQKVNPPVQFEDDFDEYHARAESGGSLYGLLRRQAFMNRGKTSPERRKVVRQRSRSLIPKSVALPEEKSILKMLCEYTEMSRGQTDLEQRRHSTACLEDAKDAHHIHPLSPIHSIQSTLNAHAVVYHQNSDMKKRDPDSKLPVVYHPNTDMKKPDLDSKLPVGFSAEDGLLSPGATNGLRPPEVLPGFPVGTPSMYRRRSFSVTPKGLINEGDDIVTFQQQLQQQQQQLQENPLGIYCGSTGSDLHLLSKTSRSCSYNSVGSVYSWSSSETCVHRVLMLGGPGVGKSALTQQFLTSEYMAAQNTSFDCGVECTVPVLLDGEESFIEFIDLPYTGEPRVWQEYEVEMYIVVYSTTDRRSFKKAVDLLTDIRHDENSSSAMIILVANKTDLVRSRLVGEQEAKAAAQTYDCKYIEVSAILNHHVDELLVGMLKQLRSKPTQKSKKKKLPLPRADSGETGCLAHCRHSTLSAFLGSPLKFLSKSCENLLSFG